MTYENQPLCEFDRRLACFPTFSFIASVWPPLKIGHSPKTVSISNGPVRFEMLSTLTRFAGRHADVCPQLCLRYARLKNACSSNYMR